MVETTMDQHFGRSWRWLPLVTSRRATSRLATRSWGVPRLSRNRQWARRSPASRLHHVTNRGVDRSPLLSSLVDRLVFPSILAAVCLDSGIGVRAFCMTDLTDLYSLASEQSSMLCGPKR